MIDTVSSVTVTDISDSMPMVMEDIPQLDINDLTLPCCDIESSSSVPPQYCISSKYAGNCLECNLSHDGVDCQNHTFYLYLDEDEPEFPCLLDILEEPDRPEYCSQNGGDCSTCSLVNYGLDCMNNRVSKEVQP